MRRIECRDRSCALGPWFSSRSRLFSPHPSSVTKSFIQLQLRRSPPSGFSVHPTFVFVFNPVHPALHNCALPTLICTTPLLYHFLFFFLSSLSYIHIYYHFHHFHRFHRIHVPTHCCRFVRTLLLCCCFSTCFVPFFLFKLISPHPPAPLISLAPHWIYILRLPIDSSGIILSVYVCTGIGFVLGYVEESYVRIFYVLLISICF